MQVQRRLSDLQKPTPRMDLWTLKQKNDDMEIQSREPGDEGAVWNTPGEKLLGRMIDYYGTHLALSNTMPVN